jgi:hypothetical protein
MANIDPLVSAAQGSRREVDPIWVFIFGLFSVILGLCIALIFGTPNSFQLSVIAVFIALGSAAICTAFTGFLEIQSTWIKAGGALGVFVFVCFFILRATGNTAGGLIP